MKDAPVGQAAPAASEQQSSVRSQNSRLGLLVAAVSTAPDDELPDEEHVQPSHQKLRKTNRKLIFAVLVFLANAIIANIALFIWRAKQEDGSGVCEQPACVLAAARMLQRMDLHADPCHDFYQFSCGNYLRSQEVPDDNFHRSMLQEMQEEVLAVIKKLIEQPSADDENEAIKKARKLYASCMDRNFRTSHYKQYEDLPVFALLSAGQLGMWPLLRKAPWDPKEFQLHRLLGELSVYQVHTLLEMYVTPDEKNASQYMLQFYKGQPAIETAYYLNASNPDYVRYLRSYRRLLRESVLLLTQGNQDSLKDAEDILQFESSFANVTENTKCAPLLANGTEDPNADELGRMTLFELQEAAPELEWPAMLTHTLNRLDVELPVPLSELIISFRCRGYLADLARLLETADSRTVANYLIWRFLFKFMPYLGNKFLQIWIEFRKDVPDANEDKLYLSRWKQCANIVNEGLGLAVGNLYVRSPYFQAVDKKALKMIKYLKKAFRSVINEEDWLEEAKKKEVIEKLDSMGNKVGYPKHIEDPVALEAEYKELNLSDGNFLQNMLILKKHEVWKELRKLTRPVDKAKEWLIQPLTVNAFHNPTTNEIIFPLGILRHPMFNLDYPMYLNFANIGVVIGHEITHGFDNHGKKYDKNGNMTNWFTEEMTARFRDRAICFAEQYSEFPLEMVGKNVDGNETLGDNICDNAGLKHSWLAYKEWVQDHEPEHGLPGIPFSVDEIFFINYGQIWCEVLNKEGFEQYTRDMHSPGRYRTMGVLQNNDDFARTFRCPVGSPMNPHHKCRLWS
ncbi:neprilysin-1-like [Neocloeon triangulifer]|uniref:neprilysin-1-like n=1 Tax=Neocloeon triangulifer TaxID=2078957 RepID=UPI00286F038B|nr:neprilysin-1-like [Neocloeon triangulifer]